MNGYNSNTASIVGSNLAVALDEHVCQLCNTPIRKGAKYITVSNYGFGAFEYWRVHTACESVRRSDRHHEDAETNKLKAIYFRDQLRRLKEVDIKVILSGEPESEVSRLLTMRKSGV